MSGVLVDRALLERLAKHADALSCAEESAPRKLRERAAEDAVSLRAALALPAQAAADAAGVLRQVAGYLTAQERVTAALSGMDGKEPGFNAEAWVDNWKQAVRERDLAQEVLESLGAAHVSALADALEVQG